ncbi:hypothetical protein PQX77_016243 [Marasmius sp. AFHP31]|nr:hypothetical protein PQX77_016243 [Marasmius sp. AFHP31]
MVQSSGTAIPLPPSHWPKELKYIQSCCFHSSVSVEARQFIRGTGSVATKNANAKKSARNGVVAIRRIADDAHPANGQHGLFAMKKIPARTHILDYIGELRAVFERQSSAQSIHQSPHAGELHCDDRPSSDYDLSLHRFQSGESIGIDASTTGNEARFINDYRGIQAKPNALFTDYRTASGELRMGIWSGNEEIKKGSEILVSYGKSWWKERAQAEQEPTEVER